MPISNNILDNDQFTFDECLRPIVKHLYKDAFNLHAHDWQIDYASHVLQMIKNPTASPPKPVLIVRSTGGGKSAVCNAIGVGAGGITINIVPLLSLGADQNNKFNKILQEIHNNNTVIHCVHLDEHTDDAFHKDLCQKLLSGDFTNKTSIFIFASPQALANRACWVAAIPQLLLQGKITLFSIDECHLYAMFGITLRSEFYSLKNILFKKPKHAPATFRLPPVLFMTATATMQMIEHLQILTGLTIDNNNILWPTETNGVSRRRSVLLSIRHRETAFKILKHEANQILLPINNNNPFKIIYYTNSAKNCNYTHKCFREWTIDKMIKLHSSKIVGDKFREMKFWYTKLFADTDLLQETDQDTGIEHTLRMRVLFATAGAANAGLDCKNVVCCVRNGFSPTIPDLSQEMGRTGRSPNRPHGVIDEFILVANFHSFVFLLFCIYVMSIIEKEEEDKEKND